MELLEAIFHSASYIGVVEQLMALSSTDLAVLFLVSKPAFIMVAGVAVLISRARNQRQLGTEALALRLPR
jgi:hypothetical protein